MSRPLLAHRPRHVLAGVVALLLLLGFAVQAGRSPEPPGRATPSGPPLTDPLLAAFPAAAPQPGCTPADLPAPAAATAEPGKHLLLGHDRAGLTVTPKAVRARTAISARSLCAGDLPALDSGMTNVTAGPRRGYRFLPHMTFGSDLEVRLPYDKALIPPGLSEQDVQIFYFDEKKKLWQALRRVGVDAATGTVRSSTNHFTDMIAATVTVPDHPETVSNDPTSIKNMNAADPAAGLTLIDPPSADASGAARLGYPLELPPGRAGMTPRLSLSYASDRADGWTGMGWDLTLPSVTVDTRWGVPRYDAGAETETYLLNGAELSPLAHRGRPAARTAEKVFRTRVESGFQRIVRHGAAPADYWWEVTAKDGTRSTFGGTPESRLTDGRGNVFRWPVREVRDTDGNTMTYAYDTVTDTGVAGGTVPGVQIYPRSINYTGFGDQPGGYTVTFTRDRDLPDYQRRADVVIDARGGFKMVTADLLKQVEVRRGEQRIRRYDLNYTRGAFGKTLLASVTQVGSGGTAFSTHSFGYHDDVAAAGDAYDGFAAARTWQTGDDNVTAGLFGRGRASALGGNRTSSTGGHAYAGFNPTSPTKQGSVGAKVGYTEGDSEGVLAMVDLNGDGLPDKVFRDSGGISFRLNTSGPDGSSDFAATATRVPTLPAIHKESTRTTSAGAEQYLLGNAFVNRSRTSTSNSTYFSDVNADGLPDLVDGGRVRFNRLGPDGVPRFEEDSAGTPVPIDDGVVDGDGLQTPGSGADVPAFPLIDTVRRWTAPFDGRVAVSGDVALIRDTSPERAAHPADGVRVAVQHDGAELWALRIGGDDYAAKTPDGLDAIEVKRGDHLYFRVGSAGDGAYDRVRWDPRIAYLDVPATPDVNGLDVYAYQASADFTTAGRRGAVVRAPIPGTVRLSGAFTKSAATTDDVTVLVLRNGQAVVNRRIDAAATGPVDVSRDIEVDKEDTIELRVRVDSPIDVSAVQWAPSIAYTASPQLPAVVDENGDPIVQLHPPFDIDTYAQAAPAGPQPAWTAPSTGTVTLTPALTVAAGEDGPVTFTVKRRGELVAKRTVQVRGGALADPSFDLAVTAGEELFLDFSAADPDVGRRLSEPRVEVRPPGDPDAAPAIAPAALHTTVPPGMFGRPYRGWAYAGYNGQGERGTAPINEADLERPFDQDSAFDPLTAAAHPFIPFPETGRWRGADEDGWVEAGVMSSSRFGPDAVAATEPATGSQAAARAVTRRSSAGQTAAGAGASFLSGSLSTGDTSGDVEFLDMNGDRFPDVVSAGRVQYTTPSGGLEDATRAVGGLSGAPRRSDATAKNVGVGGSPAAFFPNASGDVDATGGNSRRGNATGAQMTPLGLSGGLGLGDSTPSSDLADVNGDGLPDRVSSAGGRLTVALNLGYGFAAPEPWGTASLNEGASENGSLGATLGFNGGIYDFAGGVSLSKDKSQTSATLTDLNGDGLVDRVRPGGGAMRVGFNTGNGFAPDVAWGGAMSGVCADDTDLGAGSIDWDRARLCSGTTGMGAGAYFTIGIGPLCLVACYLIINPGADTSRGMAREEASLRDVDGDGYADHVASSDDSSMRVALNKTGRTNLLKSVRRPLGATITLDYTRSGNTPTDPGSRWVMSSMAVDDGHPGDGADTRLTTYTYTGGVFDRLERTFLGHGRVTEQHRDTANRNAIYRTITREYRTDGIVTAGLLAKQTTADAAGRKFAETENTYRLREVAGGAVFPERVRVDQRFFEGTATAAKSTATTYEYDGYGNVVKESDLGDAGTPDDTDTVTGYSNCPDAYIVGVPISTVVTAPGRAGKEFQRSAATVNCATGDLTQVRRSLGGGGTAVTDLAYTAEGNLRQVTGPPNARGQRYQLTYEYDPDVRTHVSRVTDSFGLTSSTEYDLRFGAPVRSTDTNTNVTSYAFDEFGRTTSVTGPYEQGGEVATIRFEYHPEAATPWALTRHFDKFRSDTDTIDTVTFADGLARPIQTKKDATVATGPDSAPADVMTVSGRVTFDAFGRTVATAYPITEELGTAGVLNTGADDVSPTRVTYDVLDRGTSIRLPDGTGTRTSFGFGPDRAGDTQFRTVTTDASGVEKRTFHNVRNLVTGVQEPHRLPSGVPTTIWTSYAYDPVDRLVTTTDDAGNVSSAEFDLGDRRTAVTTPDAGRTEYQYDAADNAISRATANLRAKGKRIGYTYDFNRLSKITYPINSQNNVTYTYGAPGAPDNRAGRVASVADGSGRQEFGYGRLGETVRETRYLGRADHDDFGLVALTDKGYTSRYVYDTFGRLQQMTYPDGEVLSYAYDSGGQVRAASGRKGAHTYPYVNRLEYDKFDQRVFQEAGNGTRTEWSYGVEDRRLATLSASDARGQFENRAYSYDRVGNVTAIVNDVAVRERTGDGIATGPTYQTFQYDDQHRLLEANGSYLGNPRKTNEYQTVLNYDSIDNIVGKWQRNEIVDDDSGDRDRLTRTSYDWVYHYEGTKPHAVSTIGDEVDGDIGFGYDPSGNLVHRDPHGGIDRTLAWDEENQIRSIDDDDDNEYFYDASGARVLKDEDYGQTAYPNQFFTVRNGLKATKHVFVGTQRIASQVVRGPEWHDPDPYEKDQFFYHSDHLGSTSDVTDKDGKLLQHQEYFAGGEGWVSESRGDDPEPDYRYAGKEFDDETGLYYFGSRYYDPRYGTWVSPDPAAEGYLTGGPQGGVFNPDNLNSYAYGYQNPLKYTDPGGALPSPWQLISIGSGVVSFVQNVREGNYGAAVVDAAGVALDTATFFTPIPSAAGSVVKAVRGADKAIDAVKAADRAGDALRTADKAADTIRSADKAADASTVNRAAGKAGKAEDAGSTAASKGPDCLTNSFAPGTLVLMADGTKKAIEDIEVGDEVLATDPATGRTVARKVTAAIVGQGAKDLVEVSFDDGSVVATAGHAFWDAGSRRWVDADHLASGETLRSAAGAPKRITATRSWSQPSRVHNLTVADIHTFYVVAGTTPVLVHNCSEQEVKDAIQKAYPERNVRTGGDARRSDGSQLTDHDVYDDDFICEVACGGGKGKVAQMEERLLPSAEGKRVAIYGPNLKGSVEKGIKKLGVPVFRNMKDLIDWVGPKR